MRTPGVILGAISATMLVTGLAQSQSDRSSDRASSRWTWTGAVDTGREVYVRNLNGEIRVEPSSGNRVEVTATKRAGRRGNIEDVEITAVQSASGGDVVICAIWPSRETRCDEDGYRSDSKRAWRDGDDRRGNDVSVAFVVHLPKGVRVTTSTVNGDLDIDGVDAAVSAHTVNGSIVARTNGGPVSAATVNGSVTVRTGALGREPLDYSTVNGQVTLEIPSGSDADVELRTVNGSIETDFPLTVEGRFFNRRVRGTIGKGGPLIRLSTTNGSISLRRG